MHIFFGVTWLSTVFPSAPQIQESPFSFFLSLTTIHSFSKILSCAHCVPATVLNLRRQCDRDRQSPALTELAFGFGETDNKQKNRMVNAMKGGKGTDMDSELGVRGAECYFNLGGQGGPHRGSGIS